MKCTPRSWRMVGGRSEEGAARARTRRNASHVTRPVEAPSARSSPAMVSQPQPPSSPLANILITGDTGGWGIAPNWAQIPPRIVQTRRDLGSTQIEPDILHIRQSLGRPRSSGRNCEQETSKKSNFVLSNRKSARMRS